MAEIVMRQIDSWTVKERRPDGDGPHPFLLLLHGLQGNEDSMWIFSARLPAHYWLAAPRGIYSDPSGGYAWLDKRQGGRRTVSEFIPAVDALLSLLTAKNFPGADLDRFYIAGFSQGAALAYTLALLHPQRVKALAGLSGYLPDENLELVKRQPLLGKHIYAAHGTLDERIPVERARADIALLQQAGAKVSYCEDEIGHKLSASCFAGFLSFFRALELDRPGDI